MTARPAAGSVAAGSALSVVPVDVRRFDERGRAVTVMSHRRAPTSSVTSSVEELLWRPSGRLAGMTCIPGSDVLRAKNPERGWEVASPALVRACRTRDARGVVRQRHFPHRE